MLEDMITVAFKDALKKIRGYNKPENGWTNASWHESPNLNAKN